MKVIVYVEIDEDCVDMSRTENSACEWLKLRMQNAFDRAWPNARMESVRVTHVASDTRRETDG